ncbi:hypothetical protein MKEN_00304200 [Mycena kentingensis (nom. inval.)]|nr:hypothetical protein MKEN_00304200 [Mycena kentingensis (nom. inval.)]
MLWMPTLKTTRSGRIFACVLQSTTFSIHEPLAAAVSAESDEQEDRESDDELDDLPGEPNALADLDEPLPDPPPQPQKRKRSQSPDFSQPPPPNGPQSAAHRRRQRKRANKIACEGHRPRTSTYSKYVASATPIETTLEPSTLPAAHGAWVGVGESGAETRGKKKARTVNDFLKMGFGRVCWDGRTARPLVDKNGRVFAVLAGQPDGTHYASAVQRMYDAMVRAAADARFRSDFKKHRRGLYAAVTVENADVQRVASFASAAFALWAPRLYQYYRKYNADLPGRRPFRASVFSSAAFNFGPNAWTYKHRDVLNLPFGWWPSNSLL